MSETPQGRRVVIAVIVMIIAGQVLAIANDVYLRQSDPSDVVLLGVLIVLSVFLLRRARWARWTIVVLEGAGGLLGFVGFIVLIAARIDAGFLSAVDSAVPALHGPLLAFTASRAFPVLAGSVLVSALLDLVAGGLLALPASVRSYFARETEPARVEGTRWVG